MGWTFLNYIMKWINYQLQCNNAIECIIFQPAESLIYHFKEYFLFLIASSDWLGVSTSILFFSLPSSNIHHIFFLFFQMPISIVPLFADNCTLTGLVLSFTYISLIFVNRDQSLWAVIRILKIIFNYISDDYESDFIRFISRKFQFHKSI